MGCGDGLVSSVGWRNWLQTPSTHRKREVHTYNPSTGVEGLRIPVTCKVCSVAQSVSSMFNDRPCFKKKTRWTGTKKTLGINICLLDICPPIQSIHTHQNAHQNMCTHMRAHTHKENEFVQLQGFHSVSQTWDWKSDLNSQEKTVEAVV